MDKMKYTNFVRETALQEIKFQEELDHFERRSLTLASYENAVLVPSGQHGGGLYDKTRFVPESNFNGRIEEVYNGPFEDCDEEVLYLGMVFGVWGHCLTDFLSRAWPLLRRKYKLAYVTCLPTNRMPDNYFALLEGLGVAKGDIIRIAKPTRFKRVYFGEASNFRDMNRSGRFFTQEYVDTIERIRSYYLDHNRPPCGGSVYLSRGGWKGGRVDLGEQLVEDAFVTHMGCKVVHPENLSLGEMINVLSGCDTLVATEGSIAHNSLFMRKGANLISIRKTDYVNWYQPMISQSRELNVTYIDANYTFIYPTGEEPWFGPFLMGVNGRLASFLGCPKSGVRMLMPFLRFTYWYSYSHARRRLSKFKRSIVAYVGRIRKVLD